MIDFLGKNIEWIFSGIGLPIIACIMKIFFKKKKVDTIIVTDNGISVSDVKVIAESVFLENYPKFAEKAKNEAIRNKDEFTSALFRLVEDKLLSSKYYVFEKPDLQFVLLEAMLIASRNDSKTKREILSNLIIERINSDENEFAEIVYNEAIKSMSLLTSEQINVLSMLYITTILMFAIKEKLVLFENYDLLENFIDKNIHLKNSDIEHLKNCKLIISTFPFELNRQHLNFPYNQRMKPILNKVKEWIETNESVGINQLKLTSLGIAISQTYNSIILETSLNLFIDVPINLADFKARNILATEDVTAYSTK